MANASIRFLLGFYPKTEDIEKKRSELIREFDELNQYARSEELTRYNYLNTFIHSPEFAERRNFYKNLSYRDSDEKKKEDEYLRLKKSKEIRFYYKFRKSESYVKFLQMDGSSEINHFESLKAFTESPEFNKVKEYMMDKKKWEKTEEYQKINEFAALAKNELFKNYFKFIKAKEYKDFEALLGSKEIALYESTEKYLQSQEYLSMKSSMKKKEFKTSEAFTKFSEFTKWKNDKRYRNYFKISKNAVLGDYKKIHNSKELQYYRELEAYVKNPGLKEREKEIKSLRFEQTDEYKKLQEYRKLNTSAPIKAYYKMKASGELSDFKKIEASNLIPDYEQLEKLIQSEEFAHTKQYLLDRKKWEKSDEYAQMQEYDTLKKSPKIIWYFKHKDLPKYEPLRIWHLVFEDDFASGKLDRKKWITRYFWGEVLLNDSYALPGEKHFFTDARNIEMNGSSLKIVTKGEKVKGKEWNPAFGFYPREFDYTSGIICSGSSFRTKYGRIEAKIRFEAADGILHAFWLAGDTMVPQIDIFKFYDNKLFLSSFWGNPSDESGVRNETVQMNSSRFAGKYLIYSIDWEPEKITWYINGLEVKSQTSNIPGESMYISLNSGVLGESPHTLSAQLEVDWIRVYQKN